MSADRLSMPEKCLLELGRVTVAFTSADFMLNALMSFFVGPPAEHKPRWKESHAFGRKLKELRKEIGRVSAASRGVGEFLAAWVHEAARASNCRNKVVKSMMVYAGTGPIQRVLEDGRFADVVPADLTDLARRLDDLSRHANDLVTGGFAPASAATVGEPFLDFDWPIPAYGSWPLVTDESAFPSSTRRLI